jgi:hypothetical protein
MLDSAKEAWVLDDNYLGTAVKIVDIDHLGLCSRKFALGPAVGA